MDILCARCGKAVDSSFGRETKQGWVCAACVTPADIAPARGTRGLLTGSIGAVFLVVAVWCFYVGRTSHGDSDMAGVMTILLLYAAGLVSGLVGLIVSAIALARFLTPRK